MSGSAGHAGRARRYLVNTVCVLLAVAVDLLGWSQITTVRGGGSAPIVLVPLLIVAVYPLLLLRNARPLQVLAVMWLFSLSGLVLPGFNPVAGLLVALYTVASVSQLRVAVSALLACFVPAAVSSYNGAVLRQNTDISVTTSFVGQLALSMLAYAAAWGVGRVAFLAKQRAEEQRMASAAEAARAERLRLARELHDSVAHAVTAIVLQAAGARTRLTTDSGSEVDDSLATIERSGVHAMEELRRMLGVLRSVAPSDTPEAPETVEQAHVLVAFARTLGVDADLEVVGQPHVVSREVDSAAYRILQEALINVAKHAGQQALCRVVIVWEPATLTLVVSSSQSGQAGGGAKRRLELSSGTGLQVMKERASAVGGEVHANPTSDVFRVTATLPLVEQSPHHHRADQGLPQ